MRKKCVKITHLCNRRLGKNWQNTQKLNYIKKPIDNSVRDVIVIETQEIAA